MKGVFLFLCLTLAFSKDYRTALPSGYWQVPVGEFDQTRGDKLMAFADFNLDGYTDIVSVDSITNMVIAINLWSQKTETFIRKQLITGAKPIVSIISADMNFDGKPDLIYVESANSYYEIKIIILDGCPLNCSYTGLQDPTGLLLGVDPVEPFLLDLHGTRVPEIFFVKQNIRQHAAVNDLTLTSDTFDSHLYNPLNSEGFKTYPQISYPTLSDHFASLVDINGDCMADLVLISKNESSTYLQFYINLRNGFLDQPKFIQMDNTLRSISFSDINFDGANDLILLYGSNSSTVLNTHVNKNPGDAYNLCSASSQFPYDFQPLVSGSIKKIQKFVLPGVISTDSSMKFVDLNLDGYNDLLLALRVDVNGVSTQAAQIYINTQCYGEQCGSYNPEYTILANTSNLRYFSLYAPITFSTSNVTTIAFFDLYEDGIPDLIMNQFVTKNVVGNVTYISVILNNKEEDAFFTKIHCLNGANVTTKTAASLPGACYEWVVTGLGGNYIPATGTQGMQVSHRSLPLPYMMSGLGRTNNYIEDVSVGIPSNMQKYTRLWSPIVPNTQLIISPYTSDPKNWKLSMKIQATQKLKIVLILTILALALVGMMIYYYHRKQQIENKENLDSFYVALS